MNGFFVIVRPSSRYPNAGRTWKAFPHEELRGWKATKGKTPEEAIALQRQQYYKKQSTRDHKPGLVKNQDWPLATGQMTRFVEID